MGIKLIILTCHAILTYINNGATWVGGIGVCLVNAWSELQAHESKLPVHGQVVLGARA